MLALAAHILKKLWNIHKEMRKLILHYKYVKKHKDSKAENEEQKGYKTSNSSLSVITLNINGINININWQNG